ncbi:MAG: DUF1573 domain-containing protein [Flavobacteriaceae bacterium]|jgi:hypothetical protein|nr:DUF1573 domain-containing protein [Flavobacteriaceae bacterium]
MKKVLLGLTFVLGVSVFTQAQKITLIDYPDNTVDYGTILQGSDGKKVVAVKNTGDKPLIISEVRPTCGCTVASWTKEPIAPNKKGEIVITYNTSSVGGFSKTINGASNDADSPSFQIKFKGTVVADTEK